MKKRLVRFLVGCLALLLSVASVGPARAAGPNTAAATPVVLSVALSAYPRTLDPMKATDTAALQVLTQTMEGLVRVGADGSVAKGSGAAADWTISPDGRTYTFTLKDKLTWTDGKSVSSVDFAYGWLRSCSPRGPGLCDLLAPIEGMTALYNLDPTAENAMEQVERLAAAVGLATPNTKTLVVKLTQPTPDFVARLANPAFLPQRMDVVLSHGNKYGLDDSAAISNGPFMLVEMNQDGMVLIKNNRYWDAAKVKVAGVAMTVATWDDAAAGYADNFVDLMTVPGSLADQYRSSPGFTPLPSLTEWYLSFNLADAKKPWLQNVHIRKALHLALDRQALVQKLGIGASAPTGWVPGLPSYRRSVGDLMPASVDAKAAQAELAQGLKELGLKELPPLELLSPNSTTFKRLTDLIVAQVKQVLPGVTLKVVTVEDPTRMSRLDQGKFELSYSGWAGDYADPANFLAAWTKESSFNDGHWTNARFDQLIQAANIQQDAAQRQSTLADTERLIMAELPALPLYAPMDYTMQKPWLQGVIPGPVAHTYDLKYATRSQSIGVAMKVSSKSAMVNGQTMPLAGAPVVTEGTPMVPLRFLGEVLGAKVTIKDGRALVELGDTTVTLQMGSKTAKLANQSKVLKVAPQVVDGVEMVPAQFLAEALGAKVEYNGTSQMITITAKVP